MPTIETKKYKVIEPFTSTYPRTGETKQFAKGDIIKAELTYSPPSLGGEAMLYSDGFRVPFENVEEYKTPYLIYAIVGLVVVGIIVYFTKKR